VLSVAVLTLVLVRPVIAWLSLLGLGHPLGESLVIAVFGIRGLGSIYYLTYASGQAKFEHIETLWATVLLIVIVSIIVHGIAVTPTMRWVDMRRSGSQRKPRSQSVH
jgi:NhaP-type Na+/H+ or K+/H+ antiporter